MFHAGAIIAALLQAAEPCASSALNCLDLYPTPDLAAVSGRVSLVAPPSPFGIAVTADGRTRYRLVATIAGLPDPKTLGQFATYIAWASTVTLDSVVKLGEVKNGRVELGEISLMQFRILVSAEPSLSVRSRSGRLVLRGTSPSARLLAHRDFAQPSALGAFRDDGRRDAGDGHDMSHASPRQSSEWSMPPMSPRLARMPGMSGLVPSVAPFVPPERETPTRPGGKPLLYLRAGDTVVLEASTYAASIGGHTSTAFGYNGRTPGPTLEVRQGDSITVRYHNALAVAGSVHWHGVRLDNRSDGAVGLTQLAVGPGESFDYRLRFPDAGVFWYHPHVREDLQQGLGLYGNIIVRPADSAYYSPVNREEVLVLSDALVGQDGPIPFGAEGPTHALMGRFGNLLLVNGRSGYTLHVKRGEVVRFILTNAANARIYNLSFGDALTKIVAGDGGRFEREEIVPSVIIAPSERYIVEVEFSRAGHVALVNRVQALDHMIGTYTRETDTLGLIHVASSPVAKRFHTQFVTLRTNGALTRELRDLREAFERPVDHELSLTLRTRNLPGVVANMLQGVNAPIEWNDGMPMMNWLTTSNEIEWVLRDPRTGLENMAIDWRFTRGSVVKLRIVNDPSAAHAMAHPIHLHGQRFLVLTRDSVRSQNLVWKDTAIIPAGQTVDVLVDMANPGRWMLHCHIAEHLSAGMMASFVVE